MTKATDTTGLRNALEVQAQPQEAKTIRDLIERMKPELVKSLGKPELVEAFVRHYNTAIRLNPQLIDCTPESMLAALLLSAQVRLEPGPLGHVYLVPYKRECVWMLGYTGILELARRSEKVGAIKARVVWDNDDYHYWEKDGDEHYELRPGNESERAVRLLVIVSWKERAAGTWLRRAIECPRSRVERARAASPAARKQTGPWVTDETAMWAKTGIRFARPWLPLTTEAGYAVSMDDSRLIDVQPDDSGAAQPLTTESVALGVATGEGGEGE